GALGEDHEQLPAGQRGAGVGEGVAAAGGAAAHRDLPGAAQQRAQHRQAEQRLLGEEPRGDARGLQQVAVAEGVEGAEVVAAGDHRPARREVLGALPARAGEEGEQGPQRELGEIDDRSGAARRDPGGAHVPAAQQAGHRPAAGPRPSALRETCPVSDAARGSPARARRRRVVGARRARVLTAAACMSRRGAKASRPRTERYFTAVVTWSSSPPGSSATPMRTVSLSSSSMISASEPTTSSATNSFCGGGTMSNRRTVSSRRARRPREVSGEFSWAKIASAQTLGSVSSTPPVGTITTSQ